MNTTKVEMVNLGSIDADPNQPRKNFDPGPMGKLMSSIKTHGVLSPLIVEESGSRYILVDGERRYRASKEIGLKQVPVIVRPAQKDTQRLIEQFHLQEQHEGWTPLEKAVAVTQLAKDMGMTSSEVADLVGIAKDTIKDYLAFSKLLSAKAFEKQSIPLHHASRITGLRSVVKSAWLKNGKDFTPEMENDLEKAIIARIKSGDITGASDFAKIRDAVKTDYTSINRFIKNDNQTVNNLFLSSNAQTAQAARRLMYLAGYITTYTARLMEADQTGLVLDSEGKVAVLTRARDALATLLR